MRPVIVQEFVSLDGVMQGPGDPHEYPRGGWQRPFIGEDHLRIIVEQMNEADALLLGRKTYQGFASAWPSMTGMNGLADRMNSMPKFVASTTLDEVGWNASLLQGDVVRAVSDLREQPGRGLVVAGSGTLVRYLAQNGLVDEYRIWIHPVIVGEGARLFEEGLDASVWKLGRFTTTSEGVAILTYRR